MIAKINSFQATLHILLETLFASKHNSVDPQVSNYLENIKKCTDGRPDEDNWYRLIEFSLPNFKISLDTDLLEFLSHNNANFVISFERLKRSLHFLEISYTHWNEVRTELTKLPPQKRNLMYFGIMDSNTRSQIVDMTLKNAARMCMESIYYTDKVNRDLLTNTKISLPTIMQKRLVNIPNNPAIDFEIQQIIEKLKIKE